MRIFCLALVLALPGQLAGHFALVQPASIHSSENDGKGAGPCGEGTESNVVTAVQGGHPLPIRMTEFVFHPGFYRFALSVKSRAELPADPDVVADAEGISISAAIQSPWKVPVLADGMFQHANPPSGDWQGQLVLPNLNCNDCTLQVIQFMADHGPNAGGGYFYHHCAALKITADPNLPPAEAAWPREATPASGAFPHVTAGGGWTTALTMVNTSGGPVAATVTFHGEDGGEMKLPLRVAGQDVVTAASISGTVNPNGTWVVTVGDSGAPVVSGWAEVQSSGLLGGFAGFRLAAGPPGAVEETAVPLQALAAQSVTLPFDNTGSFVTGLAVANAASGAASVAVSAWDEAGASLGTQTVSVAAGGHAAMVLPQQIAVTAGKRGLVRLQGAAISAMALRFSATATFISLPSISPGIQ